MRSVLPVGLVLPFAVLMFPYAAQAQGIGINPACDPALVTGAQAIAANCPVIVVQPGQSLPGTAPSFATVGASPQPVSPLPVSTVPISSVPVTLNPAGNGQAPITINSGDVLSTDALYRTLENPDPDAIVKLPIGPENIAPTTKPQIVTAPAHQRKAAKPGPVIGANRAARATNTGWDSRVYVTSRAHLALYEDTDFNAGGVSVENDYDVGYAGSFAVGYGQTYDRVRLRTEIEAGYQSADVDEHSFSGQTASGSSAAGESSVGFGFVNAFADYKLTERFAVTAGGGIGIGYVNFDEHAVSGPGTLLDDSDTVFGYHIGGGVSLDVAENIALEALYRYQVFENADLTSALGDSSDVDLDSHNITAGVRVGF